MTDRIWNFGAGPGALPESVLKQAQKDLWNIAGSGIGVAEHSHRGKVFDKVIKDAEAACRELAGIGDDYHVLFLQGGATLQFAMVPMNLHVDGKTAEYVNTGAWAKKAISDSKKIGATKVVWTDEANNYSRVPKPDEVKVSPDASYVHVTGNETIGGIEYHRYPDTGNVPLVSDASSHIMSAKVDVSKFGLIYAGAQKNLGPAGLTVVIVRKDLLARAKDTLPAYLVYRTHIPDQSMYNTPPVFAIYMMKLTFDWVKSVGGLAEMERRANLRSKTIYDAIDQSGGWYRCPVDKESRSRMNVVWRLPTEELENRFLDETKKADMSGLKGHRSVGGCRASMYNAMPIEGASHLAQFMQDFKKKNS
jgi:phosphoserine aminotransferase